MMKFRLRETGWYFALLLLLLAAAAVIAGCVTHSKPSDSEWVFAQPEDARQSVSGPIGDAATVFYQCCGKWPASVLDLRSPKCKDAAKRQQISHYLAQVPWGSVSKVAFKTAPDGRLAITLAFASRTVSTNGNSITFGGEKITETLDVPRRSAK
jgi:hypothetical protein